MEVDQTGLDSSACMISCVCVVALGGEEGRRKDIENNLPGDRTTTSEILHGRI